MRSEQQDLKVDVFSINGTKTLGPRGFDKFNKKYMFEIKNCD